MFFDIANQQRQREIMPGKNSYFLPPSSEPDEAQARLTRLYNAAGCRTQSELAEFFNIRQSSISDAKRRGTIPADWLLKLVLKKHVHPTWILTGQGPRMLQPVYDITEPAHTPEPIIITKIKPPQECSVEELITEVIRRSFINLNG